MPFLGTTGSGSVKQFGGQANLGYFIKNSLRFRSSANAYLSRTFGTPTNNTTWTFSCWIKRGAFGATYGIFAESTGYAGVYFSSEKIRVMDNAGSVASETTAVYRDPAAWAHLVVRSNGTNIKTYWNSVEVASYTGTITLLNAATSHYLARYSGASFDGYIAEINFIDGQALTPSSFGKTDAATNQWIPKKFAGTYGTNGFYLPFKTNTNTSYSYSFNSTPSYLSATSGQGIMPTGTQVWSIDFWTKFNSAPSVNWDFIHNSATGGVQIVYIAASNRFEIGAYGQADVLYSTVYPNSLVNSWNHFVATHDGTNLRIMMNGVLLASTTTYNFAAAGTTRIGTNDASSGGTLAGYISNLRVCVGSIPTSYQTSATTAGVKVYTPPTSDVTATSQGATSAHVTLLTCQGATIVDSSPTPKTLTMSGTVTSSLQPIFSQQIFVDNSGNGNNWLQSNTQTGLSNTTTYDAMIDSPTRSAAASNYCVLNPLDSPSVVLSNGNLQATYASASWKGVRASMAIPKTGQWKWEVIPTTMNYNFIAVAMASADLTTSGYTATNVFSWYLESGEIRYSNNNQVTVSATTANQVCEVRINNGAVSFYRDNVLLHTFTQTLSDISADYFPAHFVQSGGIVVYNFGQRPFTYTPTGYKSLNTFNLS